MSVFRDPPRLIDDPSQGWLQQALDDGRGELPNEAQLEGLWRRVVSAPPAGPDGGSDGGAPDGGGPADGGPTHPPPVDPSIVDPTSAATTAGSSLLSGAAAKLAGMLAVGGALLLNSATSPDAPAPLLSSGWSQSSASIHDRPPRVALQPTAPPPEQDEAVGAAAQAAPPPLATAAPATPPEADSEPEIAILMKARAAMAGSPARALALVQRAARLHPRGNLGQEREVIRVQALVRLGRRADALALARALVQRHPGSAYARRLATLFPEL